MVGSTGSVVLEGSVDSASSVIWVGMVGSGSSVIGVVFVGSLLFLIYFLTHTERLPREANPMALASSSPLSPSFRSRLYFSTLSAIWSGMSVSVSISTLLPVFLKVSCGVNSSM